MIKNNLVQNAKQICTKFFYCYLAVSSLSKHGQIEFVLHFIEGNLLMITISKTGERDKFIGKIITRIR